MIQKVIQNRHPSQVFEAFRLMLDIEESTTFLIVFEHMDESSVVTKEVKLHSSYISLYYGFDESTIQLYGSGKWRSIKLDTLFSKNGGRVFIIEENEIIAEILSKKFNNGLETSNTIYTIYNKFNSQIIVEQNKEIPY